MPAAKKTEVVTTTYLIKATDGEFQLTVPSAWKVTFGAMQPGKGGGFDGYDGRRGWTLRFYEAENKQRAVFTNVLSFRDLGLPLTRKVVRTDAETRVSESEDGRVASSVEDREVVWVADETVPTKPLAF